MAVPARAGKASLAISEANRRLPVIASEIGFSRPAVAGGIVFPEVSFALAAHSCPDVPFLSDSETNGSLSFRPYEIFLLNPEIELAIKGKRRPLSSRPKPP